jgi:glycerol-3-phosphate dehydrogenase
MTIAFNREQQLQKLQQPITWDFIVIGGGATGLGVALDAASRGYKTLLVEQSDFAKATSSRSTKLIHGGVRYLAQGKIKLVYTALRERGILIRNAKHLVTRQSFIIPCFSKWSRMKYFVGLKIYDWISGIYSLGTSTILSKQSVHKILPHINPKRLIAGVEYFDGQFDDARLAVNLAQTAAGYGAAICNYTRVDGLVKENKKVCGIAVTDLETGRLYTCKGTVVVNATGVFVDDILQMDVAGSKKIVTPSQGIHLAVAGKFLESNSAVMIPKTSDGRVLFAVPWKQHVLIGTTDTALEKNSIEPRALKTEVDFILRTLRQYWKEPPEEKDVLSVFAGLRPLAAPKKVTGNTREISRDHKLMVSESGLLTITGGKWTTYRKMAEETVNKAIKVCNLPKQICKTKNIKIHGYTELPSGSYLSVYGSDENNIRQLVIADPSLANKLCDQLPYTRAEVVWAVRNEMARTIEDVLARRIRILFFDTRAAISAAPVVAELIAKELNRDEAWKKTQLVDFFNLAKEYLLPGAI